MTDTSADKSDNIAQYSLRLLAALYKAVVLATVHFTHCRSVSWKIYPHRLTVSVLALRGSSFTSPHAILRRLFVWDIRDVRMEKFSVRVSPRILTLKICYLVFSRHKSISINWIRCRCASAMYTAPFSKGFPELIADPL